MLVAVEETAGRTGKTNTGETRRAAKRGGGHPAAMFALRVTVFGALGRSRRESDMGDCADRWRRGSRPRRGADAQRLAASQHQHAERCRRVVEHL
nr:hypothetical protein [Burkholderia multivorans]